MTLGRRIKQRRDTLNMSREDVSLASGISHTQVGRYETDTNQPTAEAIVALARALQVSTDWLLGMSDVYGIDELTDPERQALALFRAKSPERQQSLLIVMKVF